MRLTDAEWTLMNALWDQSLATAREIGERLPEENNWAYTTIKTMLSRLVAKGAIEERKRGNTSLYEPLVSRERARRSALRLLVERAFGGAVEPLVHHLVEERTLSRRDRDELIRILREEEGSHR